MSHNYGNAGSAIELCRGIRGRGEKSKKTLLVALHYL